MSEPEPEQTWMLQIGKDPTTGKWHSRITSPNDGIFTSPPCETENDALLEQKRALDVMRLAFGERITCVSRIN